MKLRYHIRKCILVLVCLFPLLSNAQTPVEEHGQLSVNGNRIVNKNGEVAKLDGMSLFWSQWYPEFYNEDVVNWLADDWCMSVIRCAMASPAEKNIVEDVIQAGINKGVYVIIDWHSHTAENEQAAAIAFFGEMAQKYGHHPNIIYEIFNEPTSQDWSTVIKPYSEAVIAEIRQYDTTNIIVCGSSTWSQDVDIASADPITGYSNIAYSLHYYAGTHGQSLRNKAITALNNGVAIFVTEYGLVNANGDGNVDSVSSVEWYDFLDQHNLGSCNWSVCDKNEGASALIPGVGHNGGWLPSELTESGTMVRDYLVSKCASQSGAPVILVHPATQTVISGSNVSLFTNALGENLNYQWYLDGVHIPGATQATYTITNFTVADDGQYRVVVSNSAGYEVSNVAYLNATQSYGYLGYHTPIPDTILAANHDIGGINVSFYDSDGTIQVNNNKMSWDPINGLQTYTVIEQMKDGSWLNYSIDAAQDGMYDISMYGNGRYDAYFTLDGDTIIPYATVNPSNTGGLQNLDLGTVFISKGEHVFTMHCVDNGSSYEINTFTFAHNTSYDCEGTFGGSAFIDSCNECIGLGDTACTGPDTSNNNPTPIDIVDNIDSLMDCYGTIRGAAYIDVTCGECIGGNTGKTQCTINSTDDINAYGDLKVYPSPAQQTLYIESGSSQITSIRLYSIIGIDVTSQVSIHSNSGNQISVQVAGLPDGMYILKTNLGERKITIRR